MVTAGAASSFLKADVVKALQKIKVPEEIKNPSNDAYQLSSKAVEYFKLDKKIIYKKIMDGSFVLSPPEVTKTKQGTSCWQNGFQLVLEKQDAENNRPGYKYTGYLIHQKVDQNGTYCGWLYRKQSAGVRTSDLNDHLKRCSCGFLKVKSKQSKID